MAPADVGGQIRFQLLQWTRPCRLDIRGFQDNEETVQVFFQIQCFVAQVHHGASGKMLSLAVFIQVFIILMTEHFSNAFQVVFQNIKLLALGQWLQHFYNNKNYKTNNNSTIENAWRTTRC